MTHSAAAVDAVLALAAEGHNNCEISRRTGIPRGTISGWEREIVERHPWRFLRGLIHSDGCRSANPVRHPKKTYRYTRYTFCNHSDEIRGLFCEACDLVGVEWRRMNRWNISVARRDSVALMDRYIGPKR